MFRFLKRHKTTVPDETARQAAALKAKIAPFRRSAWIPETRDGDGDRTASKFAGIPWLPPAEGWPACPNCDKPMQVFVQLNLATLPQRPEGCPEQGLVQLFYCTSSQPSCEVDCEAWSPGSKSVLVRLLDPSGAGLLLDASPVANAFPPKLILGWREQDDYPDVEELAEQGVTLDELEAECLADRFQAPVAGEKLMGWPAWVQSIEYPNCPRCEARMHLLFQVDSERNLPYMLGDAGCGHITQCPHHPESLAFAWACC